MDIKTKGFSMPDGNTHIFIPPAPTETDRGGITAKPRTTEAAEVVVDSGTGKGYIGTDHTLKAKGQAADSEAVGIAISEKADRIISSASGEDVILTDSAEAPLQGLRVFGKSEQVTTKGYQLFDASKLPSKSQGGATVINNGDGSFTISGDGNLTEVFDLNFSYSSEDAKKIFKIGAINKSKNATNPIISYHVRYNGKTENLGNNITEEMYNANDFTIKCIFYGRKDSKVVGGIVKPMLYQEGDGTWEPFTGGKPSPSPDNPSPIKSVGDNGNIELEVTGKNLFNTKKIDQTINGINFKSESDGSLYINGTSTDLETSVNIQLKNLNYTAGIYKVLIFGKSVESIKCRLAIRNSADSPYWYVYAGTPVHLLDFSKYDSVILQWIVEKNTSINAKIYTMLYMHGNNEYEPYRALQSLTLSTPNGLPGIKVGSGGNYTDSNGQQWICDEIDLERGKYVQRIYKNIFNGNEEWSIYNDALVGNRYSLHFPVLVKTSHLGNIFSMNTNLAIGKFGGTWDTANVYTITNNDSGSDILCSLNGDETLDNFKAFLSQKPMTVITVLQTPIERDLAPEEIAAYEALHTNYPTTVIGNDENAGMEATYVADTKNYIDKKFEKLNQAIVNTQIALL